MASRDILLTAIDTYIINSNAWKEGGVSFPDTIMRYMAKTMPDGTIFNDEDFWYVADELAKKYQGYYSSETWFISMGYYLLDMMSVADRDQWLWTIFSFSVTEIVDKYGESNKALPFYDRYPNLSYIMPRVNNLIPVHVIYTYQDFKLYSIQLAKEYTAKEVNGDDKYLIGTPDEWYNAMVQYLSGRLNLVPSTPIITASSNTTQTKPIEKKTTNIIFYIAGALLILLFLPKR